METHRTQCAGWRGERLKAASIIAGSGRAYACSGLSLVVVSAYSARFVPASLRLVTRTVRRSGLARLGVTARSPSLLATESIDCSIRPRSSPSMPSNHPHVSRMKRNMISSRPPGPQQRAVSSSMASSTLMLLCVRGMSALRLTPSSVTRSGTVRCKNADSGLNMASTPVPSGVRQMAPRNWF